MEIPFSLESSSLKQLPNLLFTMLPAMEGSLVVVDDFGQSLHGLLGSAFMEALLEDIRGQVIAVSQNMELMDVLPASSIFILSSNYTGCKEVHCLDTYEIPTSASISRLYRKGAFGGIPNPGPLDFGYFSSLVGED